MPQPEGFWRFVLAALACWRITHLLAEEDGPWNLSVRLRSMAGQSTLGDMLDCFYCLSVWIALPFSKYVADCTVDALIGWAAISGAACLFERVSAAAGDSSLVEIKGKED